MEKIKLTKGQFAIVDDADYPYLAQFKWQAFKAKHTYYATRAFRPAPQAKQLTIFMHRELLGLTDRNEWGDHKNHNGLDNRRQNIRKCNRSQNTANKSPQPDKTSKYLGVCKYGKKWRAGLKFKGKQYHLGDYESESAAALAYNMGATKFHGEFANLNQIAA